MIIIAIKLPNTPNDKIKSAGNVIPTPQAAEISLPRLGYKIGVDK